MHICGRIIIVQLFFSLTTHCLAQVIIRRRGEREEIEKEWAEHGEPEGGRLGKRADLIWRRLKARPTKLANRFKNIKEKVTGPEDKKNPLIGDDDDEHDYYESEVFVHSVCDVCQEGCSGHRYHCAQCADYDVCETCYDHNDHKKTTHDQSHTFVMIEDPNQQDVGNTKE
jgi:hypothetical protein